MLTWLQYIFMCSAHPFLNSSILYMLFILFNKSGMIISTYYLKIPQSALSRLARSGLLVGQARGKGNLI